MAKREEETRSGWGPFDRYPGAIIVLVCLAVIAFGLYVVWDRFGAQIFSGESYVITEDSIEITPQPAWVHGDVRHEAFVSGSLDGLNIKQTDLTLRVAEAFSMHSWVARVSRAGKRHTNRVEVDIVYRKPVAMVEVERGVYPIDAFGVFLPPAGFSPEEARKYPLIFADGAAPIGPPGTSWGDPRIAGAAKLAEYLTPHWEKLGLARITAHIAAYGEADLQATTYELHTSSRQVFTWGRAPGEEARGEAKPDKKVARLREIVLGTVPLDDMIPDQAIDLRYPKVEVAARPED